jgi:hypothetical protein
VELRTADHDAADDVVLALAKIAAPVSVTVRRVQVRLWSSCPLQPLFARCVARLQRIVPDTA